MDRLAGEARYTVGGREHVGHGGVPVHRPRFGHEGDQAGRVAVGRDDPTGHSLEGVVAAHFQRRSTKGVENRRPSENLAVVNHFARRARSGRADFRPQRGDSRIVQRAAFPTDHQQLVAAEKADKIAELLGRLEVVGQPIEHIVGVAAPGMQRPAEGERQDQKEQQRQGPAIAEEARENRHAETVTSGCSSSADWLSRLWYWWRNAAASSGENQRGSTIIANVNSFP